MIDEPPEIVAMNARGAIDLVDFAQQCAMCTQQHAMYPDDYRLGYETVEGNRKRTRE